MSARPPQPPAADKVISDLDEQERQLSEDYDWCLREAVVQRTYAGQVVAVHRKKVWGAGNTHGEAVQAALAQPGCPPRQSLAKVVIEGSVREENER
jgi:hypothetical protein